MAKRIVKSEKEQIERDSGDLINRLIHDMENNLQVISMEAHLRLKSKRGPRCALDAAEDIERLLGQVRQYFLLPVQDDTNTS